MASEFWAEDCFAFTINDPSHLFPCAWRLAVRCDNYYGAALIVNEQNIPLTFDSRRDVDLAINALVEAGITTIEHVKAAGRSEIVRICCESLLW